MDDGPAIFLCWNYDIWFIYRTIINWGFLFFFCSPIINWGCCWVLTQMGSFNGVVFTMFVFFNTIGFSISLSIINILTLGFPLRFQLQVCMRALYFSHNTAMASVAPDNVKLYCILITSILAARSLLASWVNAGTPCQRKSLDLTSVQNISWRGFCNIKATSISIFS